MARSQTAHAQLDQLRQQAAAERVKARPRGPSWQRAKARMEEASGAITDGYATDDQRAVARARKSEEEAVAEVRELQHRVDGAVLRV